MAMDYDLEKIYIDGIYKVLDLSVEDLKTLKEMLDKVHDETNREVYINVNYLLEDMPEELKDSAYEVKPQ